MIIKASQRGGALQLARHLLKTEENEHVEVYELRGFATEHSLSNALHEVAAIAKGTRCSQPIFSVSLNPPESETAPVQAFEDAAARIEQALGLGDQPRAIVFHEKEGRRHAHVVWSRIDAETMTAKNLSFFKRKLNDISKELFLENGWDLPDGYRDKSKRDPMNFTREEWQQARRTRQDPKDIKTSLQEDWAVSDSRVAFEKALEEKGFYLARGDRRGFVAVDFRGGVYSLSRWTGRKAKELKERLGDPKSLPSTDQTRAMIAERMSGKLRSFIQDAETVSKGRMATLALKKAQMKERHCAARQELREQQALRWAEETKERAGRFRTGVRGLWDWMTGKSKKTSKQNEREAYEGVLRDDRERDDQIASQLKERQELQAEVMKLKNKQREEITQLNQDVADYLRMNGVDEKQEDRRPRAHDRDHANEPDPDLGR
ncbi:MAG: relaxase/mobilization nuclease domain-containing protein [Pseudomonadota bacterium]